MYGNKINADMKAKLEDLYYSNSGVLQFFKAIDRQIQKMLANSTINIASVSIVCKQLSDSLPKLNELKFEITMLTNISEACKGKINHTISYITDSMAISEASNVASKFFQLLKENHSAMAQEQISENEQRKKREEEERRAKQERERREREEKERVAREEAERKAREEREEREKKEWIAQCAKRFYEYFFKSVYYKVPLIFPMFKNIGNWGDDYFYLKDKIYEYIKNLKSTNITFDFSNPNSYNIAYMAFPHQGIIPEVSQLKICNLTSLSFLNSVYNKVYYKGGDYACISENYNSNCYIYNRDSQLQINHISFGCVFVIKQTPFLSLHDGLPIYNELILENLNIQQFPQNLWTPKNHKPKIIVKNCLFYHTVDSYFKNYNSDSPFELVLENVRVYNK
jgi:hypothetical protein